MNYTLTIEYEDKVFKSKLRRSDAASKKNLVDALKYSIENDDVFSMELETGLIAIIPIEKVKNSFIYLDIEDS